MTMTTGELMAVVSSLATLAALITGVVNLRKFRLEQEDRVTAHIRQVASEVSKADHRILHEEVCALTFFEKDRGVVLEQRVEAVHETIKAMRDEMRAGFDRLNGKMTH